MSSIWIYEDNPLPVGNPINMNGSDLAYSLGLYDGADHGEQYPDEPTSDVLFETPESARAWLESTIKVLTPYIESGNRDVRYPDLEGWEPIP